MIWSYQPLYACSVVSGQLPPDRAPAFLAFKDTNESVLMMMCEQKTVALSGILVDFRSSFCLPIAICQPNLSNLGTFNTTYRATYEKFIVAASDYFRKWDRYSTATSLAHSMKRLGIWCLGANGPFVCCMSCHLTAHSCKCLGLLLA